MIVYENLFKLKRLILKCSSSQLSCVLSVQMHLLGSNASTFCSTYWSHSFLWMMTAEMTVFGAYSMLCQASCVDKMREIAASECVKLSLIGSDVTCSVVSRGGERERDRLKLSSAAHAHWDHRFPVVFIIVSLLLQKASFEKNTHTLVSFLVRLGVHFS